MKTNLPSSNYHQLQQNEAGEFLLINRLIEHLAQPPFCGVDQGQTKETTAEKGQALPGIGDDCAVIPSSIVGKYLLATVDSFIEGRHFLFNISTPQEVGYKAISTAVSDIAAMGGRPQFALINLQLPDDFNTSVIVKIYLGLQEFCSKFGLFIIGGNTSSAKELSISVTVIGDCETIPLLRNGARPGDDFWVSGAIGLSQLGLIILRDHENYNLPQSTLDAAVSRYQRPEPRIELGKRLLTLPASSAIDISDGIFQDSGHIALQSGLEIEFDLASLNQINTSEKQLLQLLSGGGDYELLFSAAPALRTKIESMNLELPAESRVIKCASAVKAGTVSKILIRTVDGVFPSSEIAKKYQLASLGNDHFFKK